MTTLEWRQEMIEIARQRVKFVKMVERIEQVVEIGGRLMTDWRKSPKSLFLQR